MVIQRVAAGLVAVGIFAVTGCQGLDGAAPPRPAELEDLTAHPWRLARLDRAFPVARTQTSFEFRADGRLEGNGGAAEFFGHFTLDPGGFFEVTTLQSMLLGLPPDSGAPGAVPEGPGGAVGRGLGSNLVSQQEHLESLLRQVDRAEIWRDRLMLSSRGRTRIELAPADR
ncbi:MAG: META domain-containing protein [Planctomycetota bacterium]